MTLDAAIDRIRLEGPSGSKIKEFADVAADFLSTAAGGAAVGGASVSLSGTVTGDQSPSLRDQLESHTIDAGRFAIDPSYTSLSTTGFLNWRDKVVSALLNGQHRAVRAVIPPGAYRIDGVIEWPQLDAGATNGRLILEGAGVRNTDLIGEHLSGNVMTFRGGEFVCKYFSVNATAGRKASTSDAGDNTKGHGIYLDPNADGDEITAATFEHIQVMSQPQDCFRFRKPERVHVINCTAYQAARHGFYYDGSADGGGVVLGISNLCLGSRAIGCAGYGWGIDGVIHGTYINLQSLECGTPTTFPYLVWTNSNGHVFINPDLEGKTNLVNFASATPLYAIKLTGKCHIYGGFIGTVHYGVQINSISNCSVEHTNFSGVGSVDSSGSISMIRAIQLQSATKNTIRLASSYGSVSSITDTTQYAGNFVYLDGVLQNSYTSAQLGSATNTINTANKYIYKEVINTTDGYKMYATGASATDPWKGIKLSDGSVGTITPV